MNEQQSNMTAIEGNKLIAGFMSVKWDDSLKQWEYRPGHWYKELQYHSSWDWLMLVVEKIEQIEKTAFQYQSFENGHAQILLSVDGTVQAGCMFDKGQQKEAYYNVVVQFIKWHNSQSTDKQKQL